MGIVKVKYVKVIVPRLSSTKSVKKQMVAHFSRKNTGALAFWGDSPARPPANFACLGTERRHELSGDGVRAGVPAENGFTCNLIFTDHL